MLFTPNPSRRCKVSSFNATLGAFHDPVLPGERHGEDSQPLPPKPYLIGGVRCSMCGTMVPEGDPICPQCLFDFEVNQFIARRM